LEYHDYNTQLYDKVYFNTDSGGYVVVHKLHGKGELEQNLEIAEILAEKGEKILLLPDNKNIKSPDALRNGIIWEFKTISNAHNLYHALQNSIRKGKKQSENILIYINQAYTNENIAKALKSAVNMDNPIQIKEINILYHDKRLIKMERDEIENNSFGSKL